MLRRLLPITVASASLLQAQQPLPRIDTTGRAIRFDFPALHIGVAEFAEGPTATTVFYFPRGVKAAVDAQSRAQSRPMESAGDALAFLPL